MLSGYVTWQVCLPHVNSYFIFSSNHALGKVLEKVLHWNGLLKICKFSVPICYKVSFFVTLFIPNWKFKSQEQVFLSLWNWAEYLWLLTLDSVLCNLWLLSFALSSLTDSSLSNTVHCSRILCSYLVYCFLTSKAQEFCCNSVCTLLTILILT